MKNKHPEKNGKTPLIIAHRGFSGKFPENTMAAFKNAIKMKADMIECDVHLTKDKKLIITHDYRLGRNIKGSGNLQQYTLKELQNMDNGSWFDPKFKSEKAPTLKQLLDLIKKHKKVELNIEIKDKTLKSPEHSRHMAKSVVELCKKMKMTKQVLISSKDFPVLEQVRKLSKSIRIGVLDDFPNHGLRMVEIHVLKAYSYHPNFKRLSYLDVKKLHTLGIKVYPYTPKTLKHYELLNVLGVDGLISDHVDKLKNYFLHKN